MPFALGVPAALTLRPLSPSQSRPAPGPEAGLVVVPEDRRQPSLRSATDQSKATQRRIPGTRRATSSTARMGAQCPQAVSATMVYRRCSGARGRVTFRRRPRRPPASPSALTPSPGSWHCRPQLPWPPRPYACQPVPRSKILCFCPCSAFLLQILSVSAVSPGLAPKEGTAYR